jgi:hypothetical protein
VQKKEACKKRKYDTKDPYITMTEDDAEIVTDKVQYRGEEVVRIVEAQWEEIVSNLIEVHENIQQLWSQARSHAIT